MCLKIVCYLIIFLPFDVFSEDVLVTLPNGILRGKRMITPNKTNFYGFVVPYAEPPIGQLRFKAPKPPKSWQGILDTTDLRVICFQVNRDLPIESEDCLYLNIYTPKLSANISSDLPVILYIHGGGFIQGTCLPSLCGPEFFIEMGLVVVTINYRLGFLSTEDEILPGNYGLKDQHQGIKWTHDNIQFFGGDPSRITIIGQSAGAASATYQLLNKKSEGLFWGVIAQSGSFLSPWSFQRKSREIAFETASFLNISASSSKELYNLLVSVPAKELDAASFQLHQKEKLQNRQINQGYFYAPVIESEGEEAFITQKMYISLKSGDFVKVPIMIGITSEESLEDANDLGILQENMKSYDENLDWLVPENLNIKRTEKAKKVGALIRSFYASSRLALNLAGGIKYFSDTSFTRSLIKHALLQAKYTDVFFYQFSFDGSIGNVSTLLKGAENVAHTEDLRYMWRIVFENYDNTNINEFSLEDIGTHRRMLKLWSNFAKTLNPTPESEDLLENVSWPTVSSGRPQNFFYLDINRNLTIKNYPKIGTYLGWHMIYEAFGEEDFDTF